MKTALHICAITFLLSACVTTKQTETSAAVKLSLTDRVQAAVTEVQKSVTEALPDEIAGLKSVEPVADREKNQRGAGFTRAYTADDIVATVFIYNNQNFGVSEEDEVTMDSLMDKHLQEFLSLQDSGLYANVKTGAKKQREFKWKSIKYQVLEADVLFSQKEEAKKSFLVLGANKDLMSYIRIRYTYPKSKQAEMNKKQSVFTRTVMTVLHDFAAAQQTPAAQ
ncbi:MAG: hypothetical protein J5787_05315 [Alphaproteobacteria bacterium]|nr:hypothetical protein [Alphaproteobacteria bacterium]MBO4643324.1 hypothetical protein [Alphaproteobacteria bacterium]